jgi:subtilisin family serine protease
MKHTHTIFKTAALFCFALLINQNIFAQSSLKANAKDWLALDPKTDSIAGISLYKAYKLLKGRTSKTVIVAVIDNGINIVHEDLKNIIWTNTKEIPDNGIDDDHNGYIDDVHGWNFRGSKNGTIIENEQSGATQIYVAWKNKYENADTNSLKPNEKREWAIYNKAKTEYFDKINTSKDSTELKISYNINYISSKLIANDSENSNNHYYGNPYFKLTSNLSHGTHVAGIIAAQRNKSNRN